MGGRLSGVRTRVRTRRVVPFPKPAAQGEATLTVPGGHTWTVLSVSGVLTTDVGSTGDLPALEAAVEGQTVGRWSVALALAASIAHRVTWSVNAQSVAMYDTETVGIPEVILPPGSVLSTRTLNIAAGDQWDPVSAYVVDEWIHAGPISLDRLDLEVVGVIEPSA